MNSFEKHILALAAFALLFLPVTVLHAEKIPALDAIPGNLPDQIKRAFQQRKDKLDKIYAVFKRDGDAFTAKKAKDQSDEEYNALQARRAQYILAAKTFNQDLAEAEPVKALAEPLVARVAFSQGKFYFVTKNGRKLSGVDASTAPLDGGTRVVTGPDAKLQFLLPDETIFTLGPNSDMVLDDFVYDPNTSATKVSAKIAKGQFHFITGKKAVRKDIKIHIPFGDLGFRGTDCECVVEPGGAGYVKLFEGRLEITKKKTGAKFLLNAGQIVRFTAEGIFSEPTPLKP